MVDVCAFLLRSSIPANLHCYMLLVVRVFCETVAAPGAPPSRSSLCAQPPTACVLLLPLLLLLLLQPPSQRHRWQLHVSQPEPNGAHQLHTGQITLHGRGEGDLPSCCCAPST
jgi:hypothetical protein